jgi:hypothetical protein
VCGTAGLPRHGASRLSALSKQFPYNRDESKDDTVKIYFQTHSVLMLGNRQIENLFVRVYT